MLSQTPSFASRSHLSTMDSQLFRANSFRFTHFCKNASANPLESHSFKTKDLKPFRFIHFQKKVGVGYPDPKSNLKLPTSALLVFHRPLFPRGTETEGSRVKL